MCWPNKSICSVSFGRKKYNTRRTHNTRHTPCTTRSLVTTAKRPLTKTPSEILQTWRGFVFILSRQEALEWGERLRYTTRQTKIAARAASNFQSLSEWCHLCIGLYGRPLFHLRKEVYGCNDNKAFYLRRHNNCLKKVEYDDRMKRNTRNWALLMYIDMHRGLCDNQLPL